jgi:ATP adenylyltransferase/5',5'''-P-1,P-4-tetraphosphate phosphorylase II
MRDVPFQYFLHNLDPCKSTSGDTLLHVYTTLLAQTREALGIPSNRPDILCPHNVVLVKGWMMLIPRRSNNFRGVTANAAGMIGYVWLTDEEQLSNWRTIGPREILSQLGVPVADTG